VSKKQGVVIGVDPHKLSVTIEVVDGQEALLGQGRFGTDKPGFATLMRYVGQIASSADDRLWAVEGANGAGRSLAQRLLAAGERVVDVVGPLRRVVEAWDPDREPVAPAAGRAGAGDAEEGPVCLTGQGDPGQGPSPRPGREDPPADGWGGDR